MVRIFVIHRPIVREEIGFPLEPKITGAIIEYFHIVRQDDGGERADQSCARVRSVRFEADRELLRSTLLQLANRIASEYDLTEFECFHRVGEVNAGEPSMLLRVAAAHYHEANRAMNDFLNAFRDIDISAIPIPL
jgi:molybdopterin synthase catalytic subunit